MLEGGHIRRFTPRSRGVSTAIGVFLTAGVVTAVPGLIGTNAALASSPTDPGATCTLSGITIQNDAGTTQPGAIDLTVQDVVAGLKSQISPYHINATRSFGALAKGTTAPVTSSFTQDDPDYSSSGSLQVTSTAGVKTVCLGQFKNVIPGGRTYSTGFAFPSDRNNLVFQNSSVDPIPEIAVQINASCQFTVDLTPGELWSTDMTNLEGTGVNCLFADTVGSSSLNSVVITAVGSAADVGEAVVFGVGPYVYSPLPE